VPGFLQKIVLISGTMRIYIMEWTARSLTAANRLAQIEDDRKSLTDFVNKLAG
jgi:hypothetical protein